MGSEMCIRDSPSIAPTEYQLQLLAKAEFVRIDLPGGDLREQAYQTMQRLDTLWPRDWKSNSRSVDLLLLSPVTHRDVTFISC